MYVRMLLEEEKNEFEFKENERPFQFDMHAKVSCLFYHDDNLSFLAFEISCRKCFVTGVSIIFMWRLI
jgi:hypothetical protein